MKTADPVVGIIWIAFIACLGCGLPFAIIWISEWRFAKLQARLPKAAPQASELSEIVMQTAAKHKEE